MGRDVRCPEHGLNGGAAEEAKPSAVRSQPLGGEDAVDGEGVRLEIGQPEGARGERAEDGGRIEEMSVTLSRRDDARALPVLLLVEPVSGACDQAMSLIGGGHGFEETFPAGRAGGEVLADGAQMATVGR